MPGLLSDVYSYSDGLKRKLKGLLADPTATIEDQRDQEASPYALPPSVMRGGYQTQLNPLQEMAFQQWVKNNGVPFDPSPKSDYDMRGFWSAMMNGDKSVQTGQNSNDGMLHYTDTYKTPYHQSFSAESKYAAPGAPRWNELDQLVTPSARIVFDERKLPPVNKLNGLLGQ